MRSRYYDSHSKFKNNCNQNQTKKRLLERKIGDKDLEDAKGRIREEKLKNKNFVLRNDDHFIPKYDTQHIMDDFTMLKISDSEENKTKLNRMEERK